MLLSKLSTFSQHTFVDACGVGILIESLSDCCSDVVGFDVASDQLATFVDVLDVVSHRVDFDWSAIAFSAARQTSVYLG